MAEAHPVGFQWVLEAKARGAKVIHVDPRFSRTSALADLHVRIRAGADIAFVGGLINYVLRSDKYFRDYMLACTNASTILTEDYADTEDLDGVFSGLDRARRGARLRRRRGSSGAGHRPDPAASALRVPGLQAALRPLYPELVAQVAGVPEELFTQVASAITESSGRHRYPAGRGRRQFGRRQFGRCQFGRCPFRCLSSP